MIKDLFFPERVAHRHAGEFYQDHPTSARVIGGAGAAVSGLFKPFLAPLIAAVGLVAMPILAGVRAYNGEKEGAVKALKAWAVCPLVLVGTVLFMGVTAYSMPLIASISLVVTICALSVIYHVRSVMREPLSS